MGLQRLVDERHVGVDEAWPRCDHEGPVRSAIEHAVDDVGMYAKLGGDRPSLPLLDLMKATDLVLLRGIDGHGITPVRQS